MSKLDTSQTLQTAKPALNNLSGGILQRKCATCGTHTVAGDKCEDCKDNKGILQRKSTNSAEQPEVPPIVHEVLNSQGQPLKTEMREFLEPRFEHDFSRVRVHTDENAAKSAQAINALAYTVGDDIVFDKGQFQPETKRGIHLLSHELSHVVQQRKARTSTALVVGEPNTGLERQADKAAENVAAGKSAGVLSGGEQAIQRQSNKSINLPPVNTGNDPKTGSKKPKVSDDSIEMLAVVADSFLDKWHTQMISALNLVSTPEDKESINYWWVALAGNLMWAATTLMPVVWKVPIKIVSFLGASLGSGVMQKVLSRKKLDGKRFLAIKINRLRDYMGTTIRPIVEDVAVEAASKNITDWEERHKMLWKRYFPDVPKEKAYEVLGNAAVASAESALAEFDKQYKKWQSEIKAIVSKERAVTNPYKGYSSETKAARAGWFLYSTTDSEFVAAEEKHPFKPELKF